jgi:hypothetical protein
MSWKDSVRQVLMGAPYEEVAVVAPTEVVSPLVPVPLDAPEPTMVIKENIITALRRAEFSADAPVLSANDAAVRQVSFRDRFAPPSTTVEAATRARLQLEADAPVSARPARLITSPELERAEKRGIRMEYQSLTPVQRKIA